MLHDQTTLAAAFLMGLFGSVHCAGMCGGIACAVGMGGGAPGRGPLRVVLDVLGYNVGRVASYTLAGLLVGLAGTSFTGAMPPATARLVAALITGVFLVAVGLYLVGWTRLLVVFERAGLGLWRRVQPLARYLLPARAPWQVFTLGALWGWLPCGLVYSALVLAALAGGAATGGLHMLAFGMGTLPVVAGIGLAGRSLAEIGRQSWVRRTAGGVLIAMGAAILISNGLFPHATHTA